MMKIKLTKTKILLILLLLTVKAYSQTTCEDVKKQNKELIDKFRTYGIDINDTETKVESYSSDIDINFIKCTGDIKNQTVTISFNVVNPKLLNQIFYLNSANSYGKMVYSQAFDEIGNAFPIKTANLGITKPNSYSEFDYLESILLTGNNPIMGSVTFKNILPNVKYLRSVIFCMNHANVNDGYSSNSNKGQTIMSNVKINWK